MVEMIELEKKNCHEFPRLEEANRDVTTERIRDPRPK